MVQVRTLRPAQIAGVDYPPDVLLIVSEAHAGRLVKLGLVEIVGNATPAPVYQTRVMRAQNT